MGFEVGGWRLDIGIFWLWIKPLKVGTQEVLTHPQFFCQHTHRLTGTTAKACKSSKKTYPHITGTQGSNQVWNLKSEYLLRTHQLWLQNKSILDLHMFLEPHVKIAHDSRINGLLKLLLCIERPGKVRICISFAIVAPFLGGEIGGGVSQFSDIAQCKQTPLFVKKPL